MARGKQHFQLILSQYHFVPLFQVRCRHGGRLKRNIVHQPGLAGAVQHHLVLLMDLQPYIEGSGHQLVTENMIKMAVGIQQAGNVQAIIPYKL